MLKKIIQCKPVIPLMTGLLTPVLVTPAEALTVNLDGIGNIISVEDVQIIERGVEIPGEEFLFTITSTYDINFLYGSFDDIFRPEGSLNTSCEVGETGNRLCFLDNPSRATLVMDAMNNAFNEINPIPSNVVGTPIGLAPDFPPDLLEILRTKNLYYVPVGVDGADVTARQGRNFGTSWVTETQGFPLNSGSLDSYVGAELTAQEFEAEIPESSNVIGIIVTGLSIIVLTKKN